jgi:type II secretory pathway pseudopilin PulG
MSAPGAKPRAAGLTLLELLIALTLLVLVLSLSVPSILVTLDRRQFYEVREQVLTYMTLVRAEAQLHGEVLAVYYEPAVNPDDAFGGWEDPVGFGGLTPGDVETLPGPGSDIGLGRERPARLVARPYELFAEPATRRDGLNSPMESEGRPVQRSTLRMSDAFRVSRNLPADWLEEAGLDPLDEDLPLPGLEDAESPFGEEMGGFPSLVYEDETEPIILAVFFPDGTAVTRGERLYLVHDEGNAAELVINRWTGQADLVVLVRESEAEAEEFEEDEEYDPFDEEALLEQPVEAPMAPTGPMRPEGGP